MGGGRGDAWEGPWGGLAAASGEGSGWEGSGPAHGGQGRGLRAGGSLSEAGAAEGGFWAGAAGARVPGWAELPRWPGAAQQQAIIPGGGRCPLAPALVQLAWPNGVFQTVCPWQNCAWAFMALKGGGGKSHGWSTWPPEVWSWLAEGGFELGGLLRLCVLWYLHLYELEITAGFKQGLIIASCSHIFVYLFLL